MIKKMIVDDLFLRKKVPDQAADDLLDIILNRYFCRKSTLLTPIGRWMTGASSFATTPHHRPFSTACFIVATCSSLRARATASRKHLSD